MHIKTIFTRQYNHRAHKLRGLNIFKQRFMGSFIVFTLIFSSAASLIPLTTPVAHAVVPEPTNQNECLAMGGKWNYVTGGGNNPFVCDIAFVKLMTPPEEAASMTYYQDLSQCVRDQGGTGMRGDITNLPASQDGQTDPSLWYDNNDANKTIYPQGTLQSCADVTKKALQLWGWGTDYKSFLSSAGYNYVNSGSPYWHGSSDGNTRWAAFSAPILSKVYGGSFSGIPSGMSSAAQYSYYLDVFTNQKGNQACQAQDLGIYNDITNSTYRGYVDNNQTFPSPQDQAISGLFPSDASGEVRFQKIAVINASNQIEDHGFAYETHNGCSQAADLVNRTAPGWVTWINTHPNSGVTPPNTNLGPAAESQKSSCNVDGIGWIICPISTSIAKGVDAIFGLVKIFLEFKTYTTDTKSGLYTAWAAMRNIANVVFVIAFLIIIFSQLSSVGVTNYGIKKMLPRIIIAAILVNLSYWICGIAVDLSNIIGSSLDGLMESIKNTIQGKALNVNWADAIGTVLTGVGVGAFAGAVALGGVASFTALLWMAVPVLISGLIAIVIAFFVLAARQVLIIILIVVAPLAFVAYLLPNTSKWFDKWKDTFVTLLIMYPIIALIFGGAQLAAGIILAAGNLSMIQVLFALAVQVIPLALTPIVVKFSGGVLGRFAGMVNNAHRGPLDSLKNYSKEKADVATKGGVANGTNWLNRMGQRRDNRRRTDAHRGKLYETRANSNWEERVAQDTTLQSVNNAQLAEASREAEAKHVQRKIYAKALGDKDDSLLKTAAGLGGDNAITKITAAVTAAEIEEFNKTVSAEKSTMSTTGTPALMSIMKDTNASAERRAAAVGQIMKNGSDNDIHEALNYLGTQQKDTQGNFIDTAISSIQQQASADLGSRKPLSLGAGDVANLNRGVYDGDFSSKINARLSAGKISAPALAQASADELNKIISYVQANGAALKADPVTADALKALEKDIAEFRTNPQLSGQQPSHEITSRMDDLHNLLG